MMKKSNRILRRVIAASMVLAMAAGTGFTVPVGQVVGTGITVNAEEYEAQENGDYEYEVNEDDTVTITRYNGEEKNVTIPSKIDGKQVTVIGRYAFENSRQSLQSVVIPSGVVRINERAFQYCEKLKTVSLPEGLKVLEDAVFEFCYMLREIKLPSTLEEAGTYQFQHDRSLSSVTLSPKMTRIADCMFQDCNSLEEITIPDNVEEIGNYAFCYCRNLKKVNLGTNSKLKYIRQSFQYTAMESFTMPESVEEINSWAFYGNYHLKNFTFNSKIAVIPDGLLGDCISLENIVIPGNIQEIWNRAFQDCTSLKTVRMGKNVREVAWASFENCTSLTDVYFGEALEHFGENAFAGCSSLVNFHNVPENYITFDSHVFETSKWYAEKPDGAVYFGNVLYNYKGKIAQNENVVIPEGTVSFNKSIFGENTGLKSVTIPASMGQIDFNYLFDSSKNLENITVAENHPNYKSIDGVVYTKDGNELIYCPRGKSGALVIPEGTEYINGGSLTGCTKITSLTFSKSLYDFTTVDFTTMPSLAAINVPAENEWYMSKDGVLFGIDTDNDDNRYPYLLYCCPPAKTGAYTIPDTVRDLHWSAFNNSTKLTALNIPKSVRWLMNFDNLYTMDSLTAINIAQDSELDYCTVNGILYNKDMTKMHYVPNAKSGAVTVPDGIETICGAFYNCKKVTQVNIPASVNEIYEDYFDNCTALTKFTVAQDNERYKAVNDALIRKDDNNDYLLCVPKTVTAFTVPDSIYNHDRMRENAFTNCNSLTTLNIGANFDFSWWWYYNAHFIVCPNLKTVNVDENNVNYKSIDGVAYSSDAVVFVPPAYEGVLNVPNFVTSCWDGAFRNCNKLKTINFSASYTDTVNFDIFNDSYALETVVFPNNGNYTIENGAVYNKDKTELYHVFDGTSGEFVIPSSVKSVSQNAFINCAKLTKIVVNNDIGEFNANLYGCKALKVLEVPASVINMYSENFENVGEDFTIEGYAGSYAERYANYHGYTFHRLSDEITLNKTSVTTAVGRTFKLVPTIKTDSTFDKTVTFASENAKVAKVAADGTVMAVAAGTVKLTATTVNGKTASCLVTVNPALSNVSEISSDNILVGGTSTITAKAQDGTGSYKYTVDYRLSGAANWTTLLAKGTTATANFTTATAGIYEIKVTVTDRDGYTAEKIFNVKVNAKLANTSTVSAAKTTLGNAVTINGSSTGGLGGTTYKYEYKLSSASAWTVLSDYSTADSTVFRPAAAGTYNVRVTAKDTSGATAGKTLNVSVTNTLANTTTVSAEKIMIGGKATVTVSAAGGMSDYTYACYMKEAGASSWTTVSGFGSKTSFELSFNKAANYIICTKVKDLNGTVAKEYVSVSVCDNLKNISSVASDTIMSGELFTVNAEAVGGMGGYTYAVSYKKTSDTNWVVKQDFSSNSTVTVKPSKAADYIINVKAKDTAGNVAEKSFNVKVNAAMTNNSSVSSDFITLGEMTVITAKAAGGMGDRSYRYEYKLSSDANWSVLSDYSDNTAAIFKPVAAGQYDIRVTVKDNTGTSEKILAVNAADVLTNTSTISAEKIVIGNTVTITGSASGGKGDYQYAYFYKKFTQKNWTKIADYSSNTTASAKPANTGDYQICVKAKDKDGTVAVEYLNVVVNAKLKNDSVISSDNITLGESVSVKAAASDGMGGYTYAILYKKASDTKWTTKQDFKANASVDIKPASAVKYDVCVKVKDSAGEIVKKFFTVNVTVPLANDSTISAENINKGDSFTVNAKATGGKGDYTYAVLYKKTTDTKWTTKQDFKTNASVDVKPASAVKYDVCVKVKDSAGTIVKKFFTVTVSDESKLTSTSSVSATSIAKGQTVTVNCAAKGGTGGYTYGVYYKKTSDANWTTKQNFTSNAVVSVKPANTATYEICVKVKDSAGTIAKEYFTVTVS